MFLCAVCIDDATLFCSEYNAAFVVCQHKTFMNANIPVFISGCEMMGAASLLRKYCSLLVSHVSNVLATATTVGEKCARSFANVTAIISKDVTGMASHFSLCLESHAQLH